MTSHSIIQLFAPPQLARADLRQRARALWTVSWPFFAVVTAVLGIAVLVEPETLARRATTVAAVGGLVIVVHAISRGGRPLLASWMLVMSLSVVVTQRAWITGGIHAPVAVFYALFIVMAGALLDWRGALVTAAVCTLGAIVLTIGTTQGWLTPRPGAGAPLGGFVFAVLAIALALLNALTRRPRREMLDVDAVELVVSDMRSPMQVLFSRLEVLRHELRGESAQDVEAALGGAQALCRTADTLLDVSQLEAGRMPIQRSVTDLSAVASSVVSGLQSRHPTCDITVETLGDPWCTCDRELTRRIIENLVSSALKVTTTGGRVRVIIGGSHRAATVRVIDDGPRVPPEQQTRIFEPFLADRPQRGPADESSGLALAFCRLAVEAQGGTIRVEDGAARGNVFVVELPR